MAALIRPLQEPIGPAASGTQRTERSHAFQRAWAAIPRDSSIPDKTDFRPERFASFLADIYLVELHTEAYRRVLFRLAGEHIRNALGLDLRGRNYLDFVPDEYRNTSGVSMKRMFASPPCGRWIRKEVVHGDGFRERLDLTQLPMTDRAKGLHLVLGIAEGFRPDAPHAADGHFHFERLNSEHFIDIGAGLPE